MRILLDWGHLCENNSCKFLGVIFGRIILANIGSQSCENNSCKFLEVIFVRIILANLGKQDEEHSVNINEDQNPQH